MIIIGLVRLIVNIWIKYNFIRFNETYHRAILWRVQVYTVKPLISTDLGKAKWGLCNWWNRRYTQNHLSVWVAVLETLSHTLGVITHLTGVIMPLTGIITPRMKCESVVTPQCDLLFKSTGVKTGLPPISIKGEFGFGKEIWPWK